MFRLLQAEPVMRNAKRSATAGSSTRGGGSGASSADQVVPTRQPKRAGASATSPKQPITQITAKDGQVYAINDFVYLAPDVSNELYYVGRVLEFVPPPKQHPGKQHMSVRIGWFYRPKDVLPGGKKKNHDPRLLLASMHSDINPVTSIRGKCEIMHIHHIADLDKWKAKDDTFYYDQLYDRYTHRVYDVVPLELVRNLPDEVAHALSDYLFILVEAGKASDFTERRVCNSCDRWCNPDEAVVKCVACNGAFHLGCVGLNKKPPKGFAWQCAKCNKEALEGREEREKGLERRNRGLKTSALKGGDNPGTPSGIAADALTPSSSKPENREVQMEKIELPLPVNKETVKPIWPYRYFGEYAKYRESLAEEGPDRGHPRAASRIGKAYQADLPECVPLMQSKIRIPSLNKDDKSVTPSPKSGSPREADGASGSAAINKLTGSTPPANQDQPQTLAPGLGTLIGAGTDSTASAVGPSIGLSHQAASPPSSPRAAKGESAGSSSSRSPRIGDGHQAVIPSIVRPSPSSTSPTRTDNRDPETGKARADEPESTPAARTSPKIGDPMRMDIPDEEEIPLPPHALAPTSASASTPEAGRITLKLNPPSRPKASKRKEKDSGLPPIIIPAASGRGTDEELVFRMPTDLTDQEVDNYIKRIQDSMPASIKCSDYLLNRAHEELHKAGYNIAKALQVILPLKAADLGVPAWTEQEIKAFETGITKFGHELHLVQREVKTKTLPEIVTYFYKWKKTRRYAPVYSQFCKKYRPSKQFKSQKHAMDGTALDAEGNLSGDISEDEWRAQQSPSNPNAHHHLECVNCYTTESTKWKVRQRPDLKNEILCFTCGVYWLKYGVARPVPESMRKANREHAASSAQKKSGKRKKQSIEPPASDKDKPKKKSARGKTINAAVARAPRAEEESAPPSPEWDESRPRPCAVCDDLDEEMNNQIVECAGCKLRVHKGCYGLPDQVTVEEGFLCARCQNTRQPECSVLYNCVLCAMVPGPRLSAIKRTVGNNWAHVACAIWIPEIKFGDVNTMEPIECIGIIDKKRWKQNCSICHRHEGACITCSERGCQVAFHVSCAMWSGLEMAVTEQDAVGGAEKGDVVCQAFCAKHDHRKHGLLPTPGSYEAVGAAIRASSLHQPTRLTLEPYERGDNPADADQIDGLKGKPTPNCRSTLLRHYALTRKSNTATAKHELRTGGQRRAYSMALVDKCSCHLHHQPHAPQDGCATTAQASTQQQADVKPEKVHKPNVILISLGGHGDRPKYIGRKGSDGTIISPADERGAASNSASSARHRSVTAGPSGSTSALAPPSTGPSHECIDCKNTVSAIWWQRAEVLKALGMEPVEKTHKDDAKQPADTPADAIAAGNTNNDKKRKLLSDDGHDSDPAQPSSLAADDGKPQSEPEVLGRGMRTKRRKSNPGFCEEDSGSSSSPPPPVLVPSDVNRPSHKRKSRDDDAAEQGDYGEYQSRSVGKRGRKSTVSIGPGDDGRLVIKVQPSVDKSQTGMVVDAVSSKMVAEKAKEDMICHNCWWKLKDAAATHDPEA